jgi:hypothetical protein
MTAPAAQDTAAPALVCMHAADPATCGPCAERIARAAVVGLPDLAGGLPRHPGAIQCGSCDLPIDPREPTGRTHGGEIVHASCAPRWFT